jgi:crotonobetainyl-CoA:carnitine CoA-transferase CaiB-like acyl-CoA transferase
MRVVQLSRVAANLRLQRLADNRDELTTILDTIFDMETKEIDEELAISLAACRQEVAGVRDAYSHEHLRQSLNLSLALED